MTKLFLAASVAVLAISAPATAKPGGHGDRQGAIAAPDGGQRADRSAQRAERQQSRAVRVAQSGDRAPRVERAQRSERPARIERQQSRAERVAPAQPRIAERHDQRANRVDRVQSRIAERHDLRTNRVDRVQSRMAERHDLRTNRIDREKSRMAERQDLRANRNDRMQSRIADRQQMRTDRRVQFDNRMAEHQDLRAQRIDQRFARNGFAPRYDAGEAKKLIGVPLATAASYGALNAFPSSVSYLYPDTNDYYYRYGDGYAYRVNRSSNLISALLPLFGGGYGQGQYLPSNYMSSYVPDYYGFNNFYPDSNYGCNRYANGVVYQVDCSSGMIDDVVPLYAGGYGVGQMLPSAYYNLPNEYRDTYYDNADSGYYYAPGAIYQYDQQSSLITSVAALLSPGFGIGQQLPTGYGAYNVPYGYRDNYYDSADNWYRYNNGNIYRVDPSSQLVTAIVASILT